MSEERETVAYSVCDDAGMLLGVELRLGEPQMLDLELAQDVLEQLTLAVSLSQTATCPLCEVNKARVEQAVAKTDAMRRALRAIADADPSEPWYELVAHARQALNA